MGIYKPPESIREFLRCFSGLPGQFRPWITQLLARTSCVHFGAQSNPKLNQRSDAVSGVTETIHKQQTLGDNSQSGFWSIQFISINDFCTINRALNCAPTLLQTYPFVNSKWILEFKNHINFLINL